MTTGNRKQEYMTPYDMAAMTVRRLGVDVDYDWWLGVRANFHHLHVVGSRPTETPLESAQTPSVTILRNILCSLVSFFFFLSVLF